MTEAEAIRLCQEGSPDAFRQLVEQHKNTLFGTAVLMTGDRAVAEEHVQEAFLSAWRGIRGFNPGRPFKPWIVRILVNRIVSSRRVNRLPTAPIEDAERVTGTADVLESAMSAERRDEVQAALGRLSPQHHQVVVLPLLRGTLAVGGRRSDWSAGGHREVQAEPRAQPPERRTHRDLRHGGEAMSSNDPLDREMEYTLRGYFSRRSRELEAPADTWARLERRLDQPKAGWFASHMWKALTAAAGTLAAAVVMVFVLMYVLPFDQEPVSILVGDEPEATTARRTQPAPQAAMATQAPALEAMAAPAAAPTAMAQPTAAPAAPVVAPTAAPAYRQPTPAPAAVPTVPPAYRQAAPTPAPAADMYRAAPESAAASAPAAGAQAAAEPPPAPLTRPGATTFADFARQPAVLASEDSVSTFSLDVDRTSYFLALEWARGGYQVDPASVRAEEWANAFDYGYASPSDEWGFGVQTDLVAHPLDPGKLLARIGFQAPHLPDDRPLNVTLVLDASGSMANGNRVDIARAAAEAIRQSLRPEDRIAVVHFTTDVVRELTVPHTRPDDHAVANSIGSLFPRESTNVQAGLDEGVQLAHEARLVRPDAYNYVILMSDGVANVDATDPFGILESVYDRDAANPLRLITVGVGIENYNDYLLEQLAQHGNGWYRYLNTVDQARATFSRENWLALSTPFADQTRAQVTWDPALVYSWRIVGYENRVTPDETFAEDRREFAEVYSGAATTVLYELVLRNDARLPRGERVDLGRVELRWVVPDTQQSRSQLASVTGRGDVAFGYGADPMLRMAAIVGLAADRYSALPQASADGHYAIRDDLDRLREHLDALRGDLGHLDAYHDFTYLLEHIADSVQARPPKPSGYSN